MGMGRGGRDLFEGARHEDAVRAAQSLDRWEVLERKVVQVEAERAARRVDLDLALDVAPAEAPVLPLERGGAVNATPGPAVPASKARAFREDRRCP